MNLDHFVAIFEAEFMQAAFNNDSYIGWTDRLNLQVLNISVSKVDQIRGYFVNAYLFFKAKRNA